VWKYILRRLFGAFPVILLIGIIAFFLGRIAPGDPAAVMLGLEATEDEIAQARAEMGLNQPIAVQFYRWLVGVLHGDLGRSYQLRKPVNQLLIERLPLTLILATSAQLVAMLLGLPLGVVAAIKHNTWIDIGLMVIALIGVSMPNFWLSLNLIFLFAVTWTIFPVQGFVPIQDGILATVHHLVLPALSLGLVQAALIARTTRSSMLEVLRQDYVRTARSKGLQEWCVINVHALRNALIPVLTITGLAFASLLGGSVIIETIFNLPGIGRLVVDSVNRRDYPVIQGVILLIGMFNVIVNLVVDVCYGIIDPRIQYD
jgi:peptide/nickel transport system permease protein